MAVVFETPPSLVWHPRSGCLVSSQELIRPRCLLALDPLFAVVQPLFVSISLTTLPALEEFPDFPAWIFFALARVDGGSSALLSTHGDLLR
jgi:hypothetical protein